MEEQSVVISIIEIDREIKQSRHYVAQATAKLTQANADLTHWQRLRARALSTSDSMETSPLVSSNGSPLKALGPKKAVLALLEETPNLTTREVVATLQQVIRSKASDVGATIRTTISNLKVLGKIVDDPSGRLSVV